MITIGDIISIRKGHKADHVFDEPRNGTHRYLQIEDLRPGAKLKFASDANGVMASPNDVLIAWDGANAGTIGFGLAGYAGSTLAVLKMDPRRAYAPFIGRFLQSQFKALREGCTGATIPHIDRTVLEDLRLSLPPLAEQHRLAALLEKADHLRRTRRYAQHLSDTFLQSVFLEMFGDPATNPKGWDVAELGEHTKLVSSGSTPLGGSNVYKNVGVRFIRSQNVLMNEFDFSDVVYIENKTHQKMKRTWVQPGDVLINITGASIGRVALYLDNIEANVNQHVCIIRLADSQLSPIFLSFLMSQSKFQDNIFSNQSGATRQALTFDQIKEFVVVVPPLPLQQRFAQIVQRTERLRGQQREAARQAELLFQALLHRAFQGDPPC